MISRTHKLTSTSDEPGLDKLKRDLEHVLIDEGVFTGPAARKDVFKATFLILIRAENAEAEL